VKPSLADLLTAEAWPALDRFNVNEQDILGFGWESVVFRLDGDRVLRVPRSGWFGGADPDRRRRFLADLNGKLPFATPAILEIGTKPAYTIEKLLPGKPMSENLMKLEGTARQTMWQNYMGAVESFARIELTGASYGNLLAADPITTATWPGYIARRMIRAGQANRATIERELGDFDDLLAKATALTEVLEPRPPPVLVHGDCFPGNVLMDDRQRVTAVLDFGHWTVAGDSGLELAGACLPVEMLNGCTPADSARLRYLIAERHSVGVASAMRCYRAYFALVMADPANAAGPYPRSYAWSLACLRDLARGKLAGL